jgi:hypothetical protein
MKFFKFFLALFIVGVVVSNSLVDIYQQFKEDVCHFSGYECLVSGVECDSELKFPVKNLESLSFLSLLHFETPANFLNLKIHLSEIFKPPRL